MLTVHEVTSGAQLSNLGGCCLRVMVVMMRFGSSFKTEAGVRMGMYLLLAGSSVFVFTRIGVVDHFLQIRIKLIHINFDLFVIT